MPAPIVFLSPAGQNLTEPHPLLAVPTYPRDLLDAVKRLEDQVEYLGIPLLPLGRDAPCSPISGRKIR